MASIHRYYFRFWKLVNHLRHAKLPLFLAFSTWVHTPTCEQNTTEKMETDPKLVFSKIIWHWNWCTRHSLISKTNIAHASASFLVAFRIVSELLSAYVLTNLFPMIFREYDILSFLRNLALHQKGPLTSWQKTFSMSHNVMAVIVVNSHDYKFIAREIKSFYYNCMTLQNSCSYYSHG